MNSFLMKKFSGSRVIPKLPLMFHVVPTRPTLAPLLAGRHGGKYLRPTPRSPLPIPKGFP